MKKYRKLPVEIEAVQFDGFHTGTLHEFCGDCFHEPVHGAPFIRTLEGEMVVSPGDFVIRGVNGEFYPCKPDVFEKTYESICTKVTFHFGEALQLLKEGKCVTRKGWNKSGLFVCKQVPATIGEEVIPRMQSLPDAAKKLILQGTGNISYENQCLLYDTGTGVANSWVPSVSDMFAEDWMQVK